MPQCDLSSNGAVQPHFSTQCGVYAGTYLDMAVPIGCDFLLDCRCFDEGPTAPAHSVDASMDSDLVFGIYGDLVHPSVW